MKKFFRFTPIKLLTLLLVILAFFSGENCTAQSGSFKVMSIPTEYDPSAADLAPYKQQAAAAKIGAYDLTKSLPKGYVTDGSVDYTKYIQEGINSNPKVIFPNFHVLINRTGISLKSNSTVIFDERSVLVLAPTDDPHYQMLSLYNLQNVKVYFPILQGDRKDHIGTKGEWGMGISIGGGSNIEIIHPQIYSCWGDGMYIGKGAGVPRNIKIDYPLIDYNRRNGISVITVDGLTIVHPLICNTTGTSPEAGIDFEPNGNADELTNIVVDSPVTFNNAEYGIAVSIWAMRGKVDKNADIIIKNHIDDRSTCAFLYNGFRDTRPDNNMGGNIQIINPRWKNNKTTFQRLGYSKKGPKMSLQNISVTNRGASQPDSIKDIKRKYRDGKISFQ